jgi:hypothetical protein
MKKLILLLMVFTSKIIIAQVLVDSPLYNQLKTSGQLGKVNVIANPSISITKPVKNKKPKPGSQEKANACECYIQPDASYNMAMLPNDDGSSALIQIPFSFNLYGQLYTALYINNNGNLTFTGPMGTYSATAFPSSVNGAIVAPFWGDVDTRPSTGSTIPNGQVVYKITPSAMYVNWEDVGYFNTQGDKRNTFQLIISDGIDPVIEGGNVAFCYENMDWTTGSASQGINGFGGIPATAGANKGNGISYFLISRFDHPGNDFDGALGNPDGIDWLDYKSFAFDASFSGNIPPIPDGIASCDTFRVCAAGDTADFAINFLSPEVNQSTTITFNNGGLTTLQEIANIPGNTGSLILRAIGDLATIGNYTITITATDNATPIPGVTTLSFVVVIDTILSNINNAAIIASVTCGNANLSVSNGPYDSYLWDDFSTMPTNSISASQTYGLTVSTDGCYKRIDSLFVIMQPFAVNLQGALSFCPPATFVTLTIPNENYYSSVNWSLNNPAQDSLFTNNLSSGTYTISLVDSLGYCSNDTTFTITGGAASIIFEDTLICNSIFQVPAAISSGGTWSSTSNQVLFNNTNSLAPLITFASPGTYIVSFTDNICFQTLSTNIIYPENPTIFSDTSLCDLTMQVAGTISNSGGVWTSSNPNLTFSPNASTSNPLISSITSGTYPVTFTDNSCNYATQSTITFIALPTIDIDPIACGYVDTVTGTTAFSGGIWSYYPTNLTFSPSVTTNNPVISTEYAGIYTVSFTDNACDVTLTANIEFLPNIYTQVLDTNICIGSSFELNPLILNTAIDTSHSEWTLQPGYIPTINWFWENGSTDIPRIISGAGSYIFTVSNACNTDADTATIGIKPCDITAPNIIVLSSTEGNNFFSVNTIGIVEFNCVILNRWGNVIYEYNDPEGGWNGKTSNGNLVEEGTYFYRIKATYEGGEDVIKHGFVVLKY